jgi:hypothetical protein
LSFDKCAEPSGPYGFIFDRSIKNNVILSRTCLWGLDERSRSLVASASRRLVLVGVARCIVGVTPVSEAPRTGTRLQTDKKGGRRKATALVALSLTTADTGSELDPRTGDKEVEVSKVGSRPGEQIDVDRIVLIRQEELHGSRVDVLMNPEPPMLNLATGRRH